MSDLVVDLRAWAVAAGPEVSKLLNSAADEIERLRAANKHLESVAGAVSLGDGDFRTIAKDLPRKELEPKQSPGTA